MRLPTASRPVSAETSSNNSLAKPPSLILNLGRTTLSLMVSGLPYISVLVVCLLVQYLSVSQRLGNILIGLLHLKLLFKSTDTNSKADSSGATTARENRLHLELKVVEFLFVQLCSSKQIILNSECYHKNLNAKYYARVFGYLRSPPSVSFFQCNSFGYQAQLCSQQAKLGRYV